MTKQQQKVTALLRKLKNEPEQEEARGSDLPNFSSRDALCVGFLRWVSSPFPRVKRGRYHVGDSSGFPRGQPWVAGLPEVLGSP